MSESASGILSSVAKTALSTAVGSVVSRALAPKQKKQSAQPVYISTPAPQPTPTAPPTTEAEPKVSMPVPDDAAVYARERRKAAQAASRRGGRQSTILTAVDDIRLGG